MKAEKLHGGSGSDMSSHLLWHFLPLLVWLSDLSSADKQEPPAVSFQRKVFAQGHWVSHEEPEFQLTHWHFSNLLERFLLADWVVTKAPFTDEFTD